MKQERGISEDSLSYECREEVQDQQKETILINREKEMVVFVG